MFTGGGFRTTCNCVCRNSLFGFSPYRPSAGLREGCAYAILTGFGPSTRRNVSGDIVPAPTSTSYGCCSTQPRSAQKLCSRKSNCWKVSGSGREAISDDAGCESEVEAEDKGKTNSQESDVTVILTSV